MSTTPKTSQPADSRAFSIVFPIVDANNKDLYYRQARDLANFYSSKARPHTGCLPILVKYDEDLNCYYWKPQPVHPDHAAVWQLIVDTYEPVPLTFETDDDPSAPPVVNDEAMEELRARIRRQVGIAAKTRDMGWEEVYIIAYGLFFKETGVHPAVESSRTGEKVHLDVVFRMPGGPEILLECVNAVLLKGLVNEG